MHLSGETMGAVWQLKAFVDNPEQAGGINAALEKVFRSVCDVFSNWQDTSFVSRFNCAQRGQSLQAPDSFTDVWNLACQIADKTNGAFNPCLGHLAWHRADRTPGLTKYFQAWSGDPFAAKCASDIYTQPGGLEIDLSAIAKGYAVDCAARVVESLGCRSYLMEIGGEFVSSGLKSDCQPWWIDIQPPISTQTPIRLALFNEAVATSGELYKVHTNSNHIVTTSGENMFESVTVVAATCCEADGWATALFAAGGEAKAFAEANAVKALFQTRSGDYEVSPALTPYLR